MRPRHFRAITPPLYYLGISGDGDSASIGLGQFCHIVRRRINMLYIVANNGTYGMTNGQLSATADLGSKTKSGEESLYDNIDMATLAIELGASFVARSFSGDILLRNRGQFKLSNCIRVAR